MERVLAGEHAQCWLRDRGGQLREARLAGLLLAHHGTSKWNRGRRNPVAGDVKELPWAPVLPRFFGERCFAGAN